MLILFSSGATPRYRDDIIRALALPLNSELQFRYDRRYIHADVLTRIDGRTLREEGGLICYLSADKTNAVVNYIPCRLVTVIVAECVGSSVIVRLRIGKYVHGLDEAAFRAALQPAEAAAAPQWQLAPTQPLALIGSFLLDVAAPFTGNASDDIADFEAAATRLVQFADFATPQTSLFYAITKLVDLDQEATYPAGKIPINGFYSLASGNRYEVYIYSYRAYPITQTPAVLHVTSDVEQVRFPLGTVQVVDSRYDLRRVRFHTQRQTGALAAALHIYFSDPADDKSRSADIVLPLNFSGSLFEALVRVAVIGATTAGPGMIAAYAADKLGLGNGALMLGLGIIAAATTVFAWIKK